MNWTDERIEKMKKLWAEGLSASQIAAQLGGVSRNAVIGKVHRMGLPGRAKVGVEKANRIAQNKVATPPKRNLSAPGNLGYASRSPAFAASTRTVTRQQGATMLREEIEIEADTAEDFEFHPAANIVVPIWQRLGLTELSERTCKWPVGDPLNEDFFFCGCESPNSSPYCTYHAKLAYQPVNERRRAAARAHA